MSNGAGGLLVFQNAAARDSQLPAPLVGQAVFLSETGELLTWLGGFAGWAPPWNLAWGEQEVTTVPTDSGDFVTRAGAAQGYAPLAGYSVSHLLLSNRAYRVTLIANVTSTLFIGTADLRIVDDLGNVVAASGVSTGLVGFQTPSQATLTARVLQTDKRIATFHVEAFRYDDATLNTTHIAGIPPAVLTIEDIGSFGTLPN